MGRPCSKLRKTGSYPMDLDTVEEHDRHASPGAVDSSDTEMKEVSRQQSSQHGYKFMSFQSDKPSSCRIHGE